MHTQSDFLTPDTSHFSVAFQGNVRSLVLAERLETKTHMGLGTGESIEYTKHKVSLEVIRGLGVVP